MTTASYGDWVLRCQRIGVDKDMSRICEVEQTIQLQGQTAPVAQIGFVRAPKSDALHATVVLPVNVVFPSAPKIAVEGQDPVELTWRKCVPAGCLAESILKDETQKALIGAQGTGKIESRDSAGHDFNLAFSFRGLAQALGALSKEP